MSAAFVAQLRTRPGTIELAADAGSAITIRVQMLEVWDAVGFVVAPDEPVRTVKVRALEALYPQAEYPDDFVVKFRGWEILDESASLADCEIVNGSILLITHRRRRPVQ